MGVPVITLTGTRYVSRMSTAVPWSRLWWCVDSPAAYLDLARQQASFGGITCQP